MTPVRIVRTEAEEEELIVTLALAMQVKLARNRIKGKPHWRTEEMSHLIKCFLDEVQELLKAIGNHESAKNVLYEAADVANTAAMLADVYKMEE